MNIKKEHYSKNIQDLNDACSDLIGELLGIAVDNPENKKTYFINRKNSNRYDLENVRIVDQEHIEQAVEHVKIVLKQILKNKPDPLGKLSS